MHDDPSPNPTHRNEFNMTCLAYTFVMVLHSNKTEYASLQCHFWLPPKFVFCILLCKYGDFSFYGNGQIKIQSMHSVFDISVVYYMIMGFSDCETLICCRLCSSCPFRRLYWGSWPVSWRDIKTTWNPSRRPPRNPPPTPPPCLIYKVFIMWTLLSDSWT